MKCIGYNGLNCNVYTYYVSITIDSYGSLLLTVFTWATLASIHNNPLCFYICKQEAFMNSNWGPFTPRKMKDTFKMDDIMNIIWIMFF